MKYAYHFYGAGITSFTIEINDGSGYQQIVSINGQQQTSNISPWLVDSVSLASYVDDTVQLRFTGVQNNFQGDMAIDQLVITGNLLPCLPPTNMAFANVSTTSVDITWPGSTGSAEVEVVQTGQAQGTGTLYPNAASPLTVTGLSPGTSYDVYIREQCGSINSTWIDSTFTTSLCPLVVGAFTNQNNLLQVNFDASATVAADSMAWDFGDGNMGTGITPSNVYAVPGNYTVILLAWNACGNYDTIVQNIQVCDSLIADFNVTTQGDSVYLDGTSSIGAAQFFWDLGDGTDTTGILIDYGYATPGTKVIQLIVVNLCGDSSIVTKNVKICLSPIADWTYSIISTTSNGMQVQFDATASQNASNYEWDFGDGNTLTGQVMPIHTYATPGLFYQVTLKVTNDCGESNSKRFRLSDISLFEWSEADFELYPNPATEQVSLNWNQDALDFTQIQVIDLSGKLIWSLSGSELENGRSEIDVRNWPSGTYIFSIKGINGTHQYPVIVK